MNTTYTAPLLQAGRASESPIQPSKIESQERRLRLLALVSRNTAWTWPIYSGSCSKSARHVRPYHASELWTLNFVWPWPCFERGVVVLRLRGRGLRHCARVRVRCMLWHDVITHRGGVYCTCVPLDTRCVLTVTLPDAEGIAGAVKSRESRYLKSSLKAKRLGQGQLNLRNCASCEMRGGAGVQDKVVLVLLGVVLLINLSASQIGKLPVCKYY